MGPLGTHDGGVHTVEVGVMANVMVTSADSAVNTEGDWEGAETQIAEISSGLFNN